MLVFIIPVKSARVSSDWEFFSKLVDRTVKSVLNQTDKDFKIIMVCHEVPAIENLDKIDVIPVNIALPQLIDGDVNHNNAQKENDKTSKIKVGFEHAKQYNPDFVMVVDSDDCISSKIAGFANASKDHSPGWFVSKGYNYKEGSKIIFKKNRTFNFMCGTCVIIKPDYFMDMIIPDPWVHYAHEKTIMNDGKELKALPFPAAIYSIANGENHFMSSGATVDMMKKYFFNVKRYLKLFDKLTKYRVKPVSRRLRSEFGLWPITS